MADQIPQPRPWARQWSERSPRGLLSRPFARPAKATGMSRTPRCRVLGLLAHTAAQWAAPSGMQLPASSPFFAADEQWIGDVGASPDFRRNGSRSLASSTMPRKRFQVPPGPETEAKRLAGLRGVGGSPASSNDPVRRALIGAPHSRSHVTSWTISRPSNGFWQGSKCRSAFVHRPCRIAPGPYRSMPHSSSGRRDARPDLNSTV